MADKPTTHRGRERSSEIVRSDDCVEYVALTAEAGQLTSYDRRVLLNALDQGCPDCAGTGEQASGVVDPRDGASEFIACEFCEGTGLGAVSRERARADDYRDALHTIAGHHDPALDDEVITQPCADFRSHGECCAYVAAVAQHQLARPARAVLQRHEEHTEQAEGQADGQRDELAAKLGVCLDTLRRIQGIVIHAQPLTAAQALTIDEAITDALDAADCQLCRHTPKCPLHGPRRDGGGS